MKHLLKLWGLQKKQRNANAAFRDTEFVSSIIPTILIITFFTAQLLIYSVVVHAENLSEKVIEQEQKITPLNTKKAQIPTLGSQVPEFGSLATRSASALVYCLLAVFVGFAIYKKFNPNKTITDSGEISVCVKKAITPKTALLVVKISGQKILLTQTGDNVQFLTNLHDDIYSEDLSEALQTNNLQDIKNVQTL